MLDIPAVLALDIQGSGELGVHPDIYEDVKRHGIDIVREGGSAPVYWLARHRDGHSSSRIEFHRSRLRYYWRQTTAGLGVVEAAECAEIARMLAWMICAHEQYHWYRHAVSFTSTAEGPDQSAKHRGKEEALATAWSWRVCLHQTQVSGIGIPEWLIERVVRFWFDEIAAPGYSDWARYAQRCVFEAESLDYLGKDLPDAAALAKRSFPCDFHIVDGPDNVSQWQWPEEVARNGFFDESALYYKGYTCGPFQELDLSDRNLTDAGDIGRELELKLAEQRTIWTSAPPSDMKQGKKILCLCQNRLSSLRGSHKGAMAAQLKAGGFDVICLRHQASGEVPTHLLGITTMKPQPNRCFFDVAAISKIFCDPNLRGDAHNTQEALIDGGFGMQARL